jgi:hypothetical protein
MIHARSNVLHDTCVNIHSAYLIMSPIRANPVGVAVVLPLATDGSNTGLHTHRINESVFVSYGCASC